MLAVLALLLTGLRFAVLNENRFVAASATALSSPEVSDLLGVRLTERLVEAEPDLLAVAPLVRTGATAAVRSGAAQGLVEIAARQLYRTAVAGDADTAVLRLGSLGLLTVQSLRSLSPDIAKRIPTDVDRALVSLEGGDAAEVIGTVTETAETIRWLSWITTILAVLLLGAAILARRERAAAVRRTGFSLAAAGALAVVAYFAIRSLVVDTLTSGGTRDAGFAVYDAFLGDTVSLATGTVALGLLVVVAVGALTRRASLTSSVRHRLEGLESSVQGRRVLGGLAAAVGLIILLDRDLAVRFLAPMIGLALLIGGLEALLRSATTIAEPEETVDDGEPEDAKPSRRRRPSRRLVLRGGLVALVVVVGLAAIGGSVDHSLNVSAIGQMRCNGAATTCDLRLDQATIPATHNSYSAARDGFLLANQQTGMQDQLRGGIRGFLIDTYLAQRTSRGVYTRLDLSPNSREKVEQSIGPDATKTALRLRGQIDRGVAKDGPVDVYLCHGFCELGAINAMTVMRQVRDFLLSNPHEVLVFSVEDQVPPDRFAELIRESGLLDLTWTGPVSPLPTLGEMVESGGRVLFLVEEDAGTVPWLHQQFELAQETPYNLQTSRDLLGNPGCRVGRGGKSPPMLLLNHFLGTVPPRASAAVAVNARDAILEQVDRCKRLRDRTTNLLAVDFWKTGDVVGAADHLNAVAARDDD